MVETWKKINWKFIHKRFRTPLYSFVLWNAISHHYNKSIDFHYEMRNWLNLDSNLMVDQKEWQRVQDLAIKAISENPNFLMETTDIAYRLNNEIVEFAKKNSLENNVTALNNNQLKDIFTQYIDLNLQASAFMLFPMFFDEYLEEKIRDAVITAFPEDEVDNVLHIFTTSFKPGSAQEEQIALIKHAIKQNQKALTDSDIKSFIAEFGWLKNAAMTGEFYENKEVKNRIEEIADPETKLKEIQDDRNSFLEKLNSYKLKLDEKTKILVDALQEAIFFRSWRTERIYRNAQFMDKFYREISKRINLEDFKDFFYLTPEEISEALAPGKADQKVIDERKNGFIIFADGKDTKIYSGEIVVQAKKEVSFQDKVAKTDVLEGRSAFPGLVKAQVVIITSKDDFNKMKQGYILVSHSTTPDYVPIIRMCSAIVTDEGGILSHASIISRELKIPCVIGTKVATQILKDGDMVEVDANKGTVKILKGTNEK